MSGRYDVIIVGARVAGAATAMLLARRGVRVLLVDRSSYGSDTLSTHALMRPALVQLDRWGLLDAVIASGAPPIRRTVFHYPGQRVTVDIEPLYAPRRTVLDRILVDAAIAAGAEVRFGTAVEELQRDDSGRVCGIVGPHVSERAELVVGADGIRSLVALRAGAPKTREARSSAAAVYAYFSRVDAEGYEWVYGDRVSAGIIPTNDAEVCVFAAGSEDRFREQGRWEIGRGFTRTLAMASPALALRVMHGHRTARFRGFGGVRGYYRKPFGPGWALVGDAGYFRDPITTSGISDAFRDAELLARAIDGRSTFEDYEAIRNTVTRSLFAVTDRIAAYDWTQPEIRAHLLEVSRAMKREGKLVRGFDSIPVAS